MVDRQGPREERVPIKDHRQRNCLRSFKSQWKMGAILCYDWCLWSFVFALASVQVICIFQSTFSTYGELSFGKAPDQSMYQIPGNNDDPFSDRSLVCLKTHHTYVARQLNTVLASTDSQIIDTNGSFIHGYRVISRSELVQDSSALAHWTHVCGLMVDAFSRIADSCEALGYNVTFDALRVVDGLQSQTMKLIPSALPIVILPVVDITRLARFAIPSWDGHACIFQFPEAIESTTTVIPSVMGVDRSARARQTEAWLGITNGSWKNGWLEDPERAMRWYAYPSSTRSPEPLGISRRAFDLSTGQEMDCTGDSNRCILSMMLCWGDLLCIREFTAWFRSIVISNGRRLGLFQFQLASTLQIQSVYKISTLVSNLSVFRLLFHWLLSILALHKHFRHPRHAQECRPVGIGVLSCMHGFEFLPIMLLPRFRNSLTAFFTAGVYFEGEQDALSESWFAIYPAIIEVIFFYFSILNTISKIARRRVSDAGFGPTLLILVLLHTSRQRIALSGRLGFSGTVPPAISATEAQSLSLFDFITTNAALRVNGNVRTIYHIKVTLLAMNLLPFAWSTRTRLDPSRESDLERLLAVRVSTRAGLGLSTRPNLLNNHRSLHGYELVRVGYFVVGQGMVLAIRDWLVLAMLRILSILRRGNSLGGFRVLILPITTDMAKATSEAGFEPVAWDRVLEKPRFVRIGNSHLIDSVSVWDLSALSHG